MSRRELKKAHWVELIKEQERSGLNQRDFCKEKNLKYHQLHYYRHLLKNENLLLPNTIKTNVVAPVQIKSLPDNEARRSNEIRLLLQNGIQCVLPREMEIKQIGQLVEVLLSC